MKNILAAIMLMGATVSVEALDKLTREHDFAQLHNDIAYVLEEILPKIHESQEDAKHFLDDFYELLVAAHDLYALLAFHIEVIKCDTPTELDSIYTEFTRQFSSINAKDYLETRLRRPPTATTAYERQYEEAFSRCLSKCCENITKLNKKPQNIAELVAMLDKKLLELGHDLCRDHMKENIQPYPQPFAQLSICHPEFIDSARLNALHFKAIWSELKQHYHSDDCRPGGKCHKHISDISKEISVTSQESAYQYYWSLLSRRSTQVNDDEDKQLQDLFSALHASINIANSLSATHDGEILNAIRVLIAQYIKDGIFTSKSDQNNHGAIQAVDQVLDTIGSRIPHTPELAAGLQETLASNKTIHDKIDDMYHLIDNICRKQWAAKLADTLEQLTKAQS